jgi:DNA-damage-inducible protein D
MKKELISQLHHDFESVACQSDNVEFWYARDLQNLLGYNEWRNFILVIDKAKTACKQSKQRVKDHFVDVNKMVALGSGSARGVGDIRLTRYACYLIAQNGDPRKVEIAFAQTYFAVQTRKQEVIEQRMAEVERLEAREKLSYSEKKLSGILFGRGIDEQGFVRIRGKGDEALFGGRNTSQMKKKLGAPDKRALADFLPTITIKAKDFANEITSFNAQRENLYGEQTVTHEHIKNNTAVRNLLKKKDIYPERLPAAEDIKKVGRKIKSVGKHLVKAVPGKSKK